MKDVEVKKAVYIVLWGALGALFAVVLAGIVELISYQIMNTLDTEVVLFATMIFVGVIAGLFIGPVAWRKIYVEGVRGKKYVINK